MMTDKKQTLNDRAQHLLKVLIEDYIRDGQPVSSKRLAENSQLALSSASVRNVLADLEDQGYLQAPHHSAGRIPTVRGYRFFVECLLTIQTPGESLIEEFQKEINPDKDRYELVQTASALLSKITKYAGIVTLPQVKKQLLRQVEFLPLTDNRVLVILVINAKEVQNKIIHTSRIFSPSELEQISNYLTETFYGKNLTDIHHVLANELRDQRDAVNRVMSHAIEMTDLVLEGQDQANDYILVGETNLLGLADDAGMDQLRELFRSFSQKRDMLMLLDRSLAAEGVQIYIGEESGYDVFDRCSLVTASYSVNNQLVGVLGVIGPTRMAYQQVIPLVDVTSRLLSLALNN